MSELRMLFDGIYSNSVMNGRKKNYNHAVILSPSFVSLRLWQRSTNLRICSLRNQRSTYHVFHLLRLRFTSQTLRAIIQPIALEMPTDHIHSKHNAPVKWYLLVCLFPSGISKLTKKKKNTFLNLVTKRQIRTRRLAKMCSFQLFKSIKIQFHESTIIFQVRRFQRQIILNNVISYSDHFPKRKMALFPECREKKFNSLRKNAKKQYLGFVLEFFLNLTALIKKIIIIFTGTIVLLIVETNYKIPPK